MRIYFVIMHIVLIIAVIISLISALNFMFLKKKMKHRCLSYICFSSALLCIIGYIPLAIHKERQSFMVLFGAIVLLNAIINKKNCISKENI